MRAMVLVLTHDVLAQPHCLLQLYAALCADVPVISLNVEDGGCAQRQRHTHPGRA